MIRTHARTIMYDKLQPLWFQGPLLTAHVAVEDGSLPSGQDMTSSESKILSLSILDSELCAKTEFHFAGGHFENGVI